MAENLKEKGCPQKDSAEHEEYAGAPRSFRRIWKERNSAQPDGGYSIMIQSNGSGAIARPLEIRALREIRLFGFLLNALIFDFAETNQQYVLGSKFAPGAYFNDYTEGYR